MSYRLPLLSLEQSGRNKYLVKVKITLECVLIVSPDDTCAALHCMQAITSHLREGMNHTGEYFKTFPFSVFLIICRKLFFVYGVVSICRIKLQRVVIDSTELQKYVVNHISCVFPLPSETNRLRGLLRYVI